MIRIAFSDICNKRADTDRNYLDVEIKERQQAAIRDLHDQLNKSDVSWRRGELIRNNRTSEIMRLLPFEEADLKYLNETSIMPVVQKKNVSKIVGTVRIPNHLVKNQPFRMILETEMQSVCIQPEKVSMNDIVDTVLFRVETLFIIQDLKKIGAVTDEPLEKLERIRDFVFVDGLYKDDKDRNVIVHSGVPYLAGNAGSLVLSCPKCGTDRMRNSEGYFSRSELEMCREKKCHDIVMQPIRMDELEDRWIPFWRLVDGPILPGSFIDMEV